MSVRHVEIAVQEEELEYMVIGGSEPKEVLSNYTALTGRTPVPPAWTYGLWLSTSWMPDSDAQITLDTIDKMKEYDIPLSVFHFDARWMDDLNFVILSGQNGSGMPKSCWMPSMKEA